MLLVRVVFDLRLAATALIALGSWCDGPGWSYLRCYRDGVGVVKRSVSIGEDVARLIEAEARDAGLSFSAWLSAAAETQLRLQAGRRAMAEWDTEDPLTDEERARARAELEELLGRGD